jgi:Mrp family chromosome partitioning ATPase
MTESGNEPAVGQVVVVVTGPIAAGKSTVAVALARRLALVGRSTAVFDLDEVVAMIPLVGSDVEGRWRRARIAHAGLVGGSLRGGVNAVVVDGPFFTMDERATLLADVTPYVSVKWVILTVLFDEALRRVGDDRTRGLSADPDFLRCAHRAFEAATAGTPSPDWAFDTGLTAAEEIVAAVVERLV